MALIKRKSKFTNNQKSAYHSGRGYAVGSKDRAISFKSPEMKASFMEGYKSGLASMGKNPNKYPDRKSYNSRKK